MMKNVTPLSIKIILPFYRGYFKKPPPPPRKPPPPENIFWQHQNSFPTYNSEFEKVGPVNLLICAREPLLATRLKSPFSMHV